MLGLSVANSSSDLDSSGWPLMEDESWGVEGVEEAPGGLREGDGGPFCSEQARPSRGDPDPRPRVGEGFWATGEGLLDTGEGLRSCRRCLSFSAS